MITGTTRSHEAPHLLMRPLPLAATRNSEYTVDSRLSAAGYGARCHGHVDFPHRQIDFARARRRF